MEVREEVERNWRQGRMSGEIVVRGGGREKLDAWKGFGRNCRHGRRLPALEGTGVGRYILLLWRSL